MNSLLLKISLLAIFLCGLQPASTRESRQSAPQSTAAPAAAPRTPVVVELFTSEGCSSCPPADDLLARIEHAQPFGSAEVIAVEEHVDYFNQEGWIDPFSSPDWTQREVVYDNAVRAGTPSTPQMFVDGQFHFSGGQINNVSAAILAASKIPQTAVALVQKPSTQPAEPQFSVSVSKLAAVAEKDTPEVWLLISESGLHSAVDRGENAGHELHHASVLRSIKKIGVANPAVADSPSFSADAPVKLKPTWKRENLHAVAIVQEKKSRKILGAAAIPIAN
jgi:hypothetical protein